ncbi:U6 snRNA phosphodiesterase Usb1 [Lipomyces kononenkoae]|uniref:U6 snRNA phosphodiesterase Usb1 n=1 Tax=Lipomyces kononenkoae TaxID=34357 RepID=A0ACC3T0N0_LIPKO
MAKRPRPDDRDGDATRPRVPVPPLPDRFFDQYASAPRVGDDPELHDGRTRQSPHIEGRWPTHVYCEWIPTESVAAGLESLVPATASSLVHSPLGAPLPLHVSLSPPLMLATQDRDEFRERVWAAIGDNCRCFSLKFGSADWLANPSQTRAFYVLLAKPSDQLTNLIDATNKACQAMSYPTLDNASFHVSLAWRLPDQTMPDDSADNSDRVQSVVDTLDVKMETVKIKIGRTVYRKDLPA